MQFLNKHQGIIEKVNELGSQRTPFFLFVDFLAEQVHLFLLDELVPALIQIDFPAFKTKGINVSTKKIELNKYPIDVIEYNTQFDIVKQHLHYGNSFLTNLTCETPIETTATLNEIYAASKSKYKINFKNEWVCFSPESFIKITGNKISSFPMKGTIDASLPDAEQQILEDKKEIAEHYTIVDLIRNDLSMVSTNVQVKKFRYIDKITTSDKTLLQVSSHIEGELPENFHEALGTILFSLLPAGSISGAPKKKTLDIIQEAENYQRGFYTGTAFYFDGTTIDSCVLIRFIEKKESDKGIQLVYKSGGGITIHSEAEKEYHELIDKIYVPCF